jgi:hypothetical protein
MVGGLGMIDDKDLKLSHRGRKFFLSLAQKQATSEVIFGKKWSLIGDLRENSPKDSST